MDVRNALRSLAILLLLTSALFARDKLKVEFDRGTDFSKYKTYAWVQGISAPHPAMNMLITESINYEFQARGMRPAKPEEADLLVRYDVAGQSLSFSSANDPTYAATGGIYMPGDAIWESAVHGGSAGGVLNKGELRLQMVDRSASRLVWRSIASGVLESGEKRIRQLNTVVEKMFQRYPVKPTKP